MNGLKERPCLSCGTPVAVPRKKCDACGGGQKKLPAKPSCVRPGCIEPAWGRSVFCRPHLYSGKCSIGGCSSKVKLGGSGRCPHHQNKHRGGIDPNLEGA